MESANNKGNIKKNTKNKIRDNKVPDEEAKNEIDTLVTNARNALDQYMILDQEMVDKIVYSMALVGIEHHVELAKMAVDETKRGIVEDKIIKNMFSSEYIWNHIKHQKTVGIINENEIEGFIEIAEPIGIIAGVTPVTNPTSTTIFKSLICAKTRNPIIFGFHPSAQKCSVMAAKILKDAAIKAGAPEGCIQWIENPSIEATRYLMAHQDVSLVLATGGSAMVKSAYSTGKPALGVGPGNVPCYIEKSASLERACTDVMMSKTFDNGMICASEQAVILDRSISKDFEKIMKENECYFLNLEETKKVSNFMIDKEKGAINPVVVGQSAYWIAEQSGIKVPGKTKILLAHLKGVGKEYPLSVEKLSPVLAYYKVNGKDEGFEIAEKILNMGGLGHSAVIHSSDENIIKEYGEKMKVGRIIVNSPSSQGAIGDIYNTNIPSLTLGCGSYGHNSTTSNISVSNLINKKRVAKRRVNMQWFKVPPKIYFEYNSVQYLEQISNIRRVFIVTDETMMKLGYIDKIKYYLNKRSIKCYTEIFYDINPDPDVSTVKKGVEMMKHLVPDTIIALGGGSVIDAAKAMWLFYEYPEEMFGSMRLKFMDIRKRVYKFPEIGSKVKLIAIPTTSGTGSEVTSFSVITDNSFGNIKYPLADYSLTPSVAIIDPQFVMTLPKSATADTGMDVLTHALEAYVSVMASDYTDGLALQAIKIVFKYLQRAYDGGPVETEAREKMHNASCIAGMAFTNAFLGLNHSMAHKLGGEYNIPHGRANAILLPYVIEYNSKKPTKFTAFPKYEKIIADEKYADVSKLIGVQGKDTQESVENLIKSVKDLMIKLNMPKSIKECGVDEKLFFSKLEKLSECAHSDQCTSANPRYPLIEEIKEIYMKAYYGK